VGRDGSALADAVADSAAGEPVLKADDFTGEVVPEYAGATPGSSVARVAATPAAVDLLAMLADKHGPLLLHQSGGCCDGSAPMCYPRGEFLIGDRDVFLGLIGDARVTVPVYIGGAQFEYWSHTHLTIDVVPGRGAGFSLEAPEGFRLLTRSRLFTDAETEQLEAAGPVPRGEWVP
jgi:uncharacterized protein